MSGLKPEQLARYLSSVIGERVTLLGCCGSWRLVSEESPCQANETGLRVAARYGRHFDLQSSSTLRLPSGQSWGGQ